MMRAFSLLMSNIWVDVVVRDDDDVGFSVVDDDVGFSGGDVDVGADGDGGVSVGDHVDDVGVVGVGVDVDVDVGIGVDVDVDVGVDVDVSSGAGSIPRGRRESEGR